MELTGKIVDVNGENITIHVEEPESLYKAEKYTHGYLDQVSVFIADKRQISPQQRKLAWALINDIARADIGGSWAGYPMAIHSYFKTVFAYYYGNEEFSLSNRKGTLSEANLYIDLLLNFCLEHGVGMNHRPIDDLQPSEVAKWEYACLMNHSCVICGNNRPDLAHVDSVGMGRNREVINHKGMRVMSLCRRHHSEQHQNGLKRFMDHYHLSGIKVNYEIAKLYGLNYEE